jgi:hypothetical protein
LSTLTSPSTLGAPVIPAGVSRRCTVKNVLIALTVLLGILVTANGAAAQSTPGPLEGVWQAVEVTVTGPAARTIAIPEPRPNLTILTARHYSRVEVHSERPRPVLPDPARASADELQAVWGPFVGEAGTYEVTGQVLTMRPLAAKNPAAMVPGAFITYAFRLEGNTLWVTQQGNQNGPFAHPATIKAVRVE